MIMADKQTMTAYEAAKELKQQIKTLNTLLDIELDNIKTYMGKSQVLVGLTGGEIATYKQTKPSIVFDKELFAIERPKIYAQYCQTKEGHMRLELK